MVQLTLYPILFFMKYTRILFLLFNLFLFWENPNKIRATLALVILAEQCEPFPVWHFHTFRYIIPVQPHKPLHVEESISRGLHFTTPNSELLYRSPHYVWIIPLYVDPKWLLGWSRDSEYYLEIVFGPFQKVTFSRGYDLDCSWVNPRPLCHHSAIAGSNQLLHSYEHSQRRTKSSPVFGTHQLSERFRMIRILVPPSDGGAKVLECERKLPSKFNSCFEHVVLLCWGCQQFFYSKQYHELIDHASCGHYGSKWELFWT